MKNDNPKILIGWVVTLLGLLLLLLALLAGIVGLDKNDDWGPARSSLLAVGAFLMILPHIRGVSQPVTRRLNERISKARWRKRVTELSPGEHYKWQSAASEKQISRSRKICAAVGCVLILASVIYLWLVSVGRWGQWPATTHYYHLLSEGFRAGQTHMLVDPPADLLALPDPYDVEARSGFSYLWDVSLFKDKYYLYWGPTPALVSILIGFFTMGAVGDNLLVFLFVWGTLAFLLLILRDLWLKVFRDLSFWSFIPVLIAAAFLNPLPWLMTRAAVYEAAISGGQFFFVGGLFFLLRAQVYRSTPFLNLLLGGCFWALAVGSRVTLAPAVIVLGFALTLVILKPFSTKREFSLKAVLKTAVFLSPLVAGAVVLAWYNFDRFGSILELGHRYQLGRTNKLADYARVVTVRNIPQNLFNYLLNPIRWLEVFPYIKPTWGKYSIPALRYTASPAYHTEQVAGILLSAPFVLFAFWQVGRAAGAWWRDLGDPEGVNNLLVNNTDYRLRQFYLWFSGSAVLALLPLLFLSVNSMRHEADFMPSLILLSSLAYGHMLLIHPHRRGRLFIMLFAFLVSIAGMLISLLLAVTGYNAIFESLNPALFDKLVRFFTF